MHMMPRPELVVFCLEKAVSVMGAVKGAKERREAKECIDSVKAFVANPGEITRWRCVQAANTIEGSSAAANYAPEDHDQHYDHDHIPDQYSQDDYGWHLDARYYCTDPMWLAACVAADIDLESDYAGDCAVKINDMVSEINEMRQNLKILSKIKKG